MFDYFTLNNIVQFIKILCNIATVWAAFYFILKIVKNNSRTIQIFKGILLIFLIKAIAGFFSLNAIEYLADLFIQHGPIAIIIIFQPEFRALLEKIGKTNVFSRISTLTLNERERLVDELVKACGEMSKTKTGALISLEQGHPLSDFIKTGTPMNSVVTSELLCSIFVPGTPLHDGAVILQGVKIACAAAYFPPTTQDLPTMYGARHRAAVGISEITDSITIIVSEETGNISIAEGGKLNVVSEKSLREFLTMVICQTQTEVAKERIRKDSDSEKDLEVLQKEKQEIEEKPKRIRSLLRGKNNTEKKKGEKKRFHKTKDRTMTKKEQEAMLDQQVEKIGIANLVEETMPLDHLFDSIVSESENKHSDQKKQSVLTQVKEESEQQKPRVRKKSSEEAQQERVEQLKAMNQEHEQEPVEDVELVNRKNEAYEDNSTTVVHQNVTLHSQEVKRHEISDEKPKEKEVPVQPKNNKETGNEKRVVKRSHTKKHAMDHDAASLLDDVISPEAIVLNYKSEKQKKMEQTLNTSLEDDDEGRDH